MSSKTQNELLFYLFIFTMAVYALLNLSLEMVSSASTFHLYMGIFGIGIVILSVVTVLSKLMLSLFVKT